LCQELKTETFASKVAALASKVAVAAGGAAAGESDDEEEERYTYKHIILLHMCYVLISPPHIRMYIGHCIRTRRWRTGLRKARAKSSLPLSKVHTRAHTHTYVYTYIYIHTRAQRDRERHTHTNRYIARLLRFVSSCGADKAAGKTRSRERRRCKCKQEAESQGRNSEKLASGDFI
jgi:hypothetical protein